MADSTKLARLREIKDKLTAGKLSDRELKSGVIADTDGTQIRLSDPEALAALERRIAAEEGAE